MTHDELERRVKDLESTAKDLKVALIIMTVVGLLAVAGVAFGIGMVWESAGLNESAITGLQTENTRLRDGGAQTAGRVDALYVLLSQLSGRVDNFPTNMALTARKEIENSLGKDTLAAVPWWRTPRSFNLVPENPRELEDCTGLFYANVPPDQAMRCCEGLPVQLQTRCRQWIGCQYDPETDGACPPK